MNDQWNKLSSQSADNKKSSPSHKNSPTSNTTGKGRDAIIPTKDKSPDDLEIPD